MNRKKLFKLALTMCSFSEIFLHAQQKRNVRHIDPIVDLRTPRSLFEQVHDGLNTVYVSLEIDNVSVQTLQNISNKLSSLSTTYEHDLNSTKSNHVPNDDKVFLQNMIDRIDKLLAVLQDSKSNDNNEKSNELVRSARNFCQQLKKKIVA